MESHHPDTVTTCADLHTKDNQAKAVFSVSLESTLLRSSILHEAFSGIFTWKKIYSQTEHLSLFGYDGSYVSTRLPEFDHEATTCYNSARVEIFVELSLQLCLCAGPRTQTQVPRLV